MNDPSFQGNETGPYEYPDDNFNYHNHLNPAQKYIVWMQLWKKESWEIHQACKELGLPTHTDEYVKGFMDGVSMEPPNFVPINMCELEKETDKAVHELKHTNQGMLEQL